MASKEYIGDGVYVRFDDWGGLWLTTENGVSITNEIYLEPFVWENLKNYVDSYMKEK